MRSPGRPDLDHVSEEAEEEEGLEAAQPPTTTLNSIKFDTRKSQEAFGHLIPKTKAQKEREKEILESILTQRPVIEVFEVRGRRWGQLTEGQGKEIL